MRSRWVWIFLSIAAVAAMGCLAVLLNGRSATPNTAPAPSTTLARGTNESPGGTATMNSATESPLPSPVVPNDAPPSPPTTPGSRLSEPDRVLLAAYGATLNDGPRVAIEGDPETDGLPTARELERFEQLPADWALAMATAARATTALGTTDTASGEYLVTAVSSELYQAWAATLNNPALRGTFTITRFAISDIPEDRAAPLTFVGTGTFSSTQPTTAFVIATTVTRSGNGWRVTGAEFNRYEGGQ